MNTINKVKTLIASLTCILIMNSCSKSSDSNSQTAGKSFSFTADGVTKNFETGIGFTKYTYMGGKNIDINAATTSGSTETIKITINKDTTVFVGSYLLSSNYDAFLTIQYVKNGVTYLSNQMSQATGQQDPPSSIFGSVTIDKDNNGTLTGTFSADVYPTANNFWTGGNKISIRNGKFNIVP